MRFRYAGPHVTMERVNGSKHEACSLFFRIEYLQNSQVKAALHSDYGFTSGTCEAS